MTNAQQALAKKHGSPQEFERACFAATNSGTITLDEMIDGVNRYRDEWAKAGKPEDFIKTVLKRAGLDKEEIDVVMALRNKSGDTLATAADRARNLMDLQAGCGLSDTAVANTYRDIIGKLIGFY